MLYLVRDICVVSGLRNYPEIAMHCVGRMRTMRISLATDVRTEDYDKIPERSEVTFDELCVRGSLALLVCIEMFLTSLAHRQQRFFGYKKYKSAAVMGFGDAFKQMVLSPADLADDVQDGIQEIGAGVIGATAETLYTAGGSLKNFTGLMAGGLSPGLGRMSRTNEHDVVNEADHGDGAAGVALDVAGTAAATSLPSQLEERCTTDLMAQAESQFKSSAGTDSEF